MGQKSIELGGTRGSVSDASVSRAWPNYQAAYLGSRMATGANKRAVRDAAYKDKYTAAQFLEEPARAAYLDKVSGNYKQEADECLKGEFNDWLQGNHELNDATVKYMNDPTQMPRQYVWKDKSGVRLAPGGGSGTGEPTTEMKDWSPTWWGRGQLTHLPGVRDYLREQKIHSDEQTLLMNILAETGPQNIDQAWMYFKHWVKGRPMSEASCLHDTKSNNDSDRAPFGPQKPESFYKPLSLAEEERRYHERRAAESTGALAQIQAAVNQQTQTPPTPMGTQVVPTDSAVTQQQPSRTNTNTAGQEGAVQEALRLLGRTGNAIMATSSAAMSVVPVIANTTGSVINTAVPLAGNAINATLTGAARLVGEVVGDAAGLRDDVEPHTEVVVRRLEEVRDNAEREMHDLPAPGDAATTIAGETATHSDIDSAYVADEVDRILQNAEDDSDFESATSEQPASFAAEIGRALNAQIASAIAPRRSQRQNAGRRTSSRYSPS
jgi:hypothetical protein